MGAFNSVGSLVRRVALWSLCAGFICEAQAQTRTWTGGGEDNLASTAGNWSGGVAPEAGDAIVLDGNTAANANANKNMTWDLDVEVASWAQNGYSGTVTFATVYDEAGFDCFEVAGDVTLTSGTWNHKANSGTTKTYWLNVSVGGNFTLGADAAVDVSALGYTKLYNESGETLSGNVGGSYGGWGCSPSSTRLAAPYGKFYAPDLPGTAGSIENSTGGGVFKLTCSGLATINGKIESNGAVTGYSYYTGSGGSIWLICGEITGTGTLSACSHKNVTNYPGSGGRIAVKLTKEGADFSTFDLVNQASAYALSKNLYPGSIYGETRADKENEGWLIIKAPQAADSINKYATPFSKDVTYVHLARLTLVNGQRIRLLEGQVIDLSGTVVTRVGTQAVTYFGIIMEGGDIVVDKDEFAIDNYAITTSCGWAPDTANFIIRNSGRYVLSGGAATCSGSLQMLTSGYAEVNDDLALAGGVSLASPCTLKIAANKTLSVGGDWLYAGGTFTPAAGSTVEFTGDAVANVSGTTSFANLTCTAPGKEFVFADKSKWSVSGTMTFEGADDERLSLAAATEGATWTLDTSKGAAKLKNMNVSDCKSVVSISISGGEGENNTNISFVNVTPGDTITWTGAAGAAWFVAGNWIAEHDGSRTPVATDNVVIPAEAPMWPVLSEDVEVASLTTVAGSMLSLNGFTLTVKGAANLAGDVTATDGGFVFGGDVAWSGASVGGGANVLLNNTTAQVFAPTNAALGAVAVLTPALTVDGSFSGTTVTIGDGTAAQVVSFVSGSSVACGDFLVNGDAATKNVRLKAAADGAWLLQARESLVVGATVSDSDAREGWMVETESCADAGNNLNWRFADTRTHYTGGEWPALDADTDLVIDRGVTAILPETVTALKSIFVMQGANVRIDAPLVVAEDVRFGADSEVTWNQPSTIGGELYLRPGAVLKHSGNAASEQYRIDLTVDGDATVEALARIDAVGKGFSEISDLTRQMGNRSDSESSGASHGGRGYPGNAENGTVASYGSIFTPTNVGCRGSWSDTNGGGAIHLKTAGNLRIDGVVDASAVATSQFYTGAGGSVWLECATLSGAGSILANGGDSEQRYTGSGGRISVVASEQNGQSAFTGTMQARGGLRAAIDNNAEGSGGTVYRAEGPVATLYLKNVNSHSYYRQSNDGIDLPSTKFNNDDLSRFREVSVEIGTDGTLNLMSDLAIKNLVWDSLSHIKLNGHVLRIRTKRPDDWPETGLPSWVDAGGTPENPGRVEWQVPGLIILLR